MSAGPYDPEDSVRAEGGLDCMGTMFNIVAYGHHPEGLASAIAAALEEAKRCDEMLSNYRPESELSQVNRLGSRTPMTISAELCQFFSACIAYSRASEGTFDITVGPLVKAAGFYKGTGRLPGADEVRLALDKVGYQKLILDEQNLTVRFVQEGVELDPGGIGKGFAVDRMTEILKRNGVDAALLSAGGSTIYALGAPPHEPGWKVSIKDPRKPSTVALTVSLRNEAISTSGATEKSFWAEGKIWAHIMDPRTGYPMTDTSSVSVIAPRAIDSEVWTKPYFILGRAWTEQHKPRDFRVFYCAGKTGSTNTWL